MIFFAHRCDYQHTRADPTVKSGTKQNTPLHAATIRSYASVVELLLLVCPSLVNNQNEDGETALHLAIGNGLPAQGSSSGSGDEKASNDKLEVIVSSLFHHGCDPNITNKYNNETALHYLARRLPPPASDIVTEGDKATLYSSAVSMESTLRNIFDLFVETMKTLDPVNSNLRTPLHEASKYENSTVAVCLVKAGARLCLPDSQLRTPLDNIEASDVQPEKRVRLLKLQSDMLMNVTNVTSNWLPEKEITNCQLCRTNFSLTVRKHHCRYCGRVCCKKCASVEKNIPKFDLKSARLCSTCAPVVDYIEGGPNYLSTVSPSRK